MHSTQCSGRLPDGTSCPWSIWACRLHSAVNSVVYYLGDPEAQLVKIGTTTNLKKRVAALRKERPGSLVLATEPGTYPLETRRHYQFRTLREPLSTGEREWFRKVPVLMGLIGEIRLEHGILCPGSPVYDSWVAPLRRNA